jgi:hypothetical protein
MPAAPSANRVVVDSTRAARVPVANGTVDVVVDVTGS